MALFDLRRLPRVPRSLSIANASSEAERDEGRRVSPLERFLKKWGVGGLRRSFERKRMRREQRHSPRSEQAPLQVPMQAPLQVAANILAGPVHAKRLLREHWPSSMPLRTYRIPQPPVGRITVVTDSINAGSLYGGVGTAMILAGMLCERSGRTLRLVTRTEPANPSNLGRILSTYGVVLHHDPQFAFAPLAGDNASIDIVDDELFVTTSWWTTAALRESVPREAIVYLLQEDERMFYPHGDERLRCEQLLSCDDIRFVVNSQLLFDHLAASGLANVARRGTFFEPAFPRSLFRPREKIGKKRFMFYARPNNVRNLFWFGLEVIDRLIDEAIIDGREWELILIGKDIPDIVFDREIEVTRLENLNWNEYAELVGTVDLALCLMYTPHPSYPPLDLAASGAVVVTNEFLNKTELSRYCANIISARLEPQPLIDALREGVALSGNMRVRAENLRNAGLGADWRQALAPVVEQLVG